MSQVFKQAAGAGVQASEEGLAAWGSRKFIPGSRKDCRREPEGGLGAGQRGCGG